MLGSSGGVREYRCGSAGQQSGHPLGRRRKERELYAGGTAKDRGRRLRSAQEYAFENANASKSDVN